MPKLKKLKRKKKFRANVNRKRLRNKLNKLPEIECKQIKEAWESKRSTVKNLTQMGLAYDPNKVLKIPNVKRAMLKIVEDGVEKSDSESENNPEDNFPKKFHVVKSLEEEARHPRAKLFRLPTNEVHFATYMMDKYDDDYKAMVRDRKNYNQLTWRQIKAKIEKFKSVPEQYAEYLVKKGEIVLDDPTPLDIKKLKPEILRETAEKKPDAKLSRRKRKNKASLLGSVWQEESIDDNETLNADDEHEHLNDEGENKSPSEQTDGEKKLKLFPDENDESEDEDDDEIIDNDEDDDVESDSDPKIVSKNTEPSSQKNKKLKVR